MSEKLNELTAPFAPTWQEIDDLIGQETQQELGNGPLTVGIFCTKCNAQFELNKESVAMAVMLNTPFIEYLRWIQSSKCIACDANDH